MLDQAKRVTKTLVLDMLLGYRKIRGVFFRGAGFDTVRQVAIDDDWSTLRFRRVEYIKR